MTKYLKFNNQLFNKEKILQVHMRNSFLYIRYPYIMEIKYAQINKTRIYVNVDKDVGFSLPYLDLNSSIDFAYKYETKQHMLDNLKQFTDCPNIEIINKLNDE